MLFTWNTTDLCIIFRKWHIRSTTGLIVSLVLVVFITAGYEALREFCRRYELWSRKKLDTVPRKFACVTCSDAGFYPPFLLFPRPPLLLRCSDALVVTLSI
jgi:hypothetical protein